MYRAKNNGLEDEVFRFADFCISEMAESLCPADAPLLVDEVPPTAPTNLRANNIMINSLDLTWDAAVDEFGSVIATDEAGNQSTPSDSLLVTTTANDVLPSAPTTPFPTDQSTISPNNVTLTWQTGANTDTTKIYFGENPTPTEFTVLTSNTFIPTIEENTQYYWQIIHTNVNGTTEGPIWTFTTGSLASDAPWLVFRGMATRF